MGRPDKDKPEIKDRPTAKFVKKTAASKLAKYTLSHDETTKRWVLTSDRSGQRVKTFGTKAAATKAGALEKAVGKSGSVRIKKRGGKIQEERTYPRSMDPRRSKG